VVLIGLHGWGTRLPSPPRLIGMDRGQRRLCRTNFPSEHPLADRCGWNLALRMGIYNIEAGAGGSSWRSAAGRGGEGGSGRYRGSAWRWRQSGEEGVYGANGGAGSG